MGCGINIETITKDDLVMAVEGGLADVQAMAVPETRLGLPLLGAVVESQLQDSASVE